MFLDQNHRVSMEEHTGYSEVSIKKDKLILDIQEVGKIEKKMDDAAEQAVMQVDEWKTQVSRKLSLNNFWGLTQKIFYTATPPKTY